MLRVLLALLLVLVFAAAATSWIFTRPVVEPQYAGPDAEVLQVAPLQEAITLARTLDGEMLLVVAADRAGVQAIALGEPGKYAIAAYRALGPTPLRLLAATGTTASYRWDALGMPIEGLPRNIAAGTNYRDHAEEVGHEGEPFLFPKLSVPTAWNAAVQARGRLDYEVELCAVTLAEHRADSPAPLGYLLCGDYTDRLQLVREIDLGGPMGLTGFTDAKGGAGRLPVGPLLVIPEDPDFYRKIELRLYKNDTLRQRSGADLMIWTPQELLTRALADCEPRYASLEGMQRVTDCASIPAGTLLLTGTPGGVQFHVATIWNPWAYLTRGDVVTSFATYLGYMENPIVVN